MTDKLEPCPVCGVSDQIKELEMTDEDYKFNPSVQHFQCTYCGFTIYGYDDLQELSRAVQFQKNVVRCGECKKGIKGKYYMTCKYTDAPVKADDFCSYGKKEVSVALMRSRGSWRGWWNNL